MSKNNHTVNSQEITYIVNEVKRLDEDEVKSLYGIELLEAGSVYDPTYNKTFDTVAQWAEFNIEQDDVEYEEHFYGLGRLED